MIFLKIDDVEKCARELLEKGLHHQYKHVRFSEIKTFEHGRELFMHDPSGVLWHFCQLRASVIINTTLYAIFLLSYFVTQTVIYPDKRLFECLV